MLLDLDFKFNNLKGEPMDGNRAADILADLLATKTDGAGISASKAMPWAVELVKTGKIQHIDKADLESLHKLVDQSNKNQTSGIVNLVAHPILEAIKKSQEDKKVH